MAREKTKDLISQMIPHTTHVGGKPTTADKGSDTPTMSDNVSDAPTTADNIELVRVTARIARQQRERLDNIARTEGRLLSDVIREAVRDFLNRYEGIRKSETQQS